MVNDEIDYEDEAPYTRSNRGLICPHCEYEHTDDDIDPSNMPWTEDNTGEEYECSSCDKKFLVYVHLCVEWETARNSHELDMLA